MENVLEEKEQMKNERPLTAQAAILVEQNKPLQVETIELPQELGFGQVLVKVIYSGICGAQLNEISGAKGPDKFLPHLLGHEGSAVVIDVGPGVTTVKPDDHVVMHWRPSAGIQAAPANYSCNGKKINSGWVTTFNTHAVVSENRVTTIPKGFDLRIAPLFGCAVTTALGVINNDAQLKVGQSVVIFGVGGVGLNIAQISELSSADPIVCVDIVDEKLAWAKKFGATHVINSTQTNNLDQAIRDIVGEKGADVVIDTSGNSRVIEQAYQLTQGQGRTILVGVTNKKDPIAIYPLPLHFGKVLTGSHGGDCVPDEDIPRCIKLFEKGKLQLEELITHEYSLSEINEAIEQFKSGNTGRILIKMG